MLLRDAITDDAKVTQQKRAASRRGHIVMRCLLTSALKRYALVSVTGPCAEGATTLESHKVGGADVDTARAVLNAAPLPRHRHSSRWAPWGCRPCARWCVRSATTWRCCAALWSACASRCPPPAKPVRDDHRRALPSYTLAKALLDMLAMLPVHPQHCCRFAMHSDRPDLTARLLTGQIGRAPCSSTSNRELTARSSFDCRRRMSVRSTRSCFAATRATWRSCWPCWRTSQSA